MNDAEFEKYIKKINITINNKGNVNMQLPGMNITARSE